MSDDEIAKLSFPELTELIKQLADEMELRVMAMTTDDTDYGEMPFPIE